MFVCCHWAMLVFTGVCFISRICFCWGLYVTSGVTGVFVNQCGMLVVTGVCVTEVCLVLLGFVCITGACLLS